MRKNHNYFFIEVIFMRANLMKAFFVVWGILIGLSSMSYAITVSIPGIEGKPGQKIDVSVMIDEVENLAGIKLVIKYDKSVLTYINADKTPATSSLMHVINDKNPGLLIIVMAGARGIKGKDFSLMTISFEINKDLKADQQSLIEITEAQLMSDQLKNLEYTIKSTPISIVLEKEKTKTEKKESAEKEKKDSKKKSN